MKRYKTSDYWPDLSLNNFYYLIFLDAAEITPNQFDWYCYQDRAIGFLLDVNCHSACIGRILLGSYMKKPLWVDHSASTVSKLKTTYSLLRFVNVLFLSLSVLLHHSF